MRKTVDIAFYLCTILIFCCLPSYSLEKSIILTVKPPDDSFFEQAMDGSCTSMGANRSVRMVVGLINEPSFEIKNTENAVLYDSDGRKIPIIMDKSSFYSEFGDSTINSMRIAFITDDDTIAKGSFRFEWGENIRADNKIVDSIAVYRANKDNYRVFVWENQPQKSDLANYSATLDVIVDDKADTYYLWYLLPMAMIFAMLIVRRIFLT